MDYSDFNQQGVALPGSDGGWHQTAAIIGNQSVAITVERHAIVDAPAPVNVEVRYFDGKKFVTEVHANAFGKTIVVDVNALDPKNMSAVHVRVHGTFPGQAYELTTSVPLVRPSQLPKVDEGHPEDIQTIDDYLKDAIREDAETDPYSHDKYADAAERINDAYNNGYMPKQIADAIRSNVPGALSFQASGRPQVDNPYGPNGTPQVGGVDPAKLAAEVLKAIVNSPGYKPTLLPNTFEDRGGPTGPNSMPPSNGYDGAGSAGSIPSHLTGPKAGSGTSGGNGGASKPPHDDFDVSKAGGGKNGPGGEFAPSNNVKPSVKADPPRKIDPREDQRKEQLGQNKEKQKPGSDKAMPEHKTKAEHDRHLQNENRDRANPVLLDLDGDGVEITEVSRSNTFVDSGDDGLLHRTAWAGAGDGVLFYDVGDDGKISETREYVFTEWNPAAPGDLEAIASVFDTNGDGVLSGAELAGFKVMVTAADGTTSAKTLAELGITSITLKPDATHIELPDGSVITGQAQYTKADGSTGIAANTTLSAEAQGHTVTQGVTTGADGSKTTTSKAYDAGGNLAYAIVSTSSADGSLVNTSYDDNGDGTVDRLQSITTTTVSGVKTELEVNSIGAVTADAVLASRQQTVTSADGKVIRSCSGTVSRGRDSGGTVVTFRWRREYGLAVGQQASHCLAA